MYKRLETPIRGYTLVVNRGLNYLYFIDILFTLLNII